jgi:WXXGXW repeat (2 copies)
MYRLRFVLPVVLALGAGMAMPSAQAQVAVGVSAPIPPPALPIYEQPPIPASGYLWVPGYWAWGPDGYYWVPGTWMLPPAPGLLWTPAYWAWINGAYVLVPGYWGPTVGFYGGIDYGFGYYGAGYDGGYWLNGVFFYNRAFNNFGGVHIDHFYARPEADHFHNRVSFNGGPGGSAMRPTPQQEAFARGGHMPPTPSQVQHERAAAGNRALWNSVNHGQPPAAPAHAGGFTGPGLAPAHNAPVFAHPGAAAQEPHVLPPAGRPPEAEREFHPPHAPGAYPPEPQFHPPASQFHPMPPPHPAPQPHPRPEQREEHRQPGQ